MHDVRNGRDICTQFFPLDLFGRAFDIYATKVEFSSDLELRNEFKLFPANIWIFKFFFLLVFAIKMLLDKPYGLLNLLDFKYDHFSSLCQAESQFQNSNFGGK